MFAKTADELSEMILQNAEFFKIQNIFETIFSLEIKSGACKDL
jgi:hypothetical protein